MPWALRGPLDGSEPQRVLNVRDRMRVGRERDADLSIERPSVSGAHARLELHDDQLVVVDLGSRNGTYVNGNLAAKPTPLAAGDLLQFADVVYRVVERAQSPRSGTVHVTSRDVAQPLIRFERLLAAGDVVAHFQPIVDAAGTTVGYELLGRSEVPGLERPGALFRAAEQLQRTVELSELFRRVGARAASSLTPPRIFMNSHPTESDDWRRMVHTMAELREEHPALDLTLEIHEATVTRDTVMVALREALREIGVGLAYDDFGAGQARLRELLDVPPDVLKFDIGLIRGLDAAPSSRTRMVTALVEMVRDLGIAVLAEGVETVGEAEACVEVGFELLQGFHFARPAPAEAWVVDA